MRNGFYPVIADIKQTGAADKVEVLPAVAGKSWFIATAFLVTDAEATCVLSHVSVQANAADTAGKRLRRGKFAAESGFDTPVFVQLPVGEGLYLITNTGNCDVILTGFSTVVTS